MRAILATLGAILYIVLLVAVAFLAERIISIPVNIPMGAFI